MEQINDVKDVEIVNAENDAWPAAESNVLIYKKRMLMWDSPVEYVNNMYGSHPNDNDGHEYFEEIFAECKDSQQ